MSNISCILLSAGLSSRFGSPKALAFFPAPYSNKNKTVIEYLQETLINSKLSEIIIVLGYQKELILPFILKHKKVKVVYNKDYNFGQTSSFKTGLNSTDKKSEAYMLLPVDYPLIQESTINSLIDYFADKKPLILIPTYQGKKGHPPVFSNKLLEEFTNLDNSKGLNEISRVHKNSVEYFETTDNGIIQSYNTKEEFENLKKSIT